MAVLPRRIVKETQRLMQEPVPGISAVPDETNARYFHVIVTGPGDSPFEGGLFKLELFLPEDYPMSAPKVRFITKIYHPNIDRYWNKLLRRWKKMIFSLFLQNSSTNSVTKNFQRFNWSNTRKLDHKINFQSKISFAYEKILHSSFDFV